jgi:putative transposase
MPWRLIRYQKTGDLHFVTFSCHKRRPYLGRPAARDLFLASLDAVRIRYACSVHGYVVMPEHVHVLLGEPATVPLATVLRALKLSVAKQMAERPFWMARYYDFNVFTDKKRSEKLRYLHRNPVARGLVVRPEDWEWSSFRSYLTGEVGLVKVDTWMEFIPGAERDPG